MRFGTDYRYDSPAYDYEPSAGSAFPQRLFGGAAFACIVFAGAWTIYANVLGAGADRTLTVVSEEQVVVGSRGDRTVAADGGAQVVAGTRGDRLPIAQPGVLAGTDSYAALFFDSRFALGASPGTFAKGAPFDADEEVASNPSSDDDTQQMSSTATKGDRLVQTASIAPAATVDAASTGGPTPKGADRLARSTAAAPNQPAARKTQDIASASASPSAAAGRAAQNSSPSGSPLRLAPVRTASVRESSEANRAVAEAPAEEPSIFEKLFGKPATLTLAYASPDDGVSSGGQNLIAGRYDRYTAVYDISAHTVYLPDGRRLEAHSGLGNRLDDPRYAHERMRGVTPPAVYDLRPREALFHGVPALRLIPVDDSKVFGRSGLLAHTFMLGPHGDSNGCVSFRNYNAFLQAYMNHEIKRLAVVARLD